jgi:phosphoenolpyruvate-protein kinase (PTS system EI component)
MAELNRIWIAAVFTADADFQLGASGPAAFNPDLDQLANTFLVDGLERIGWQDFTIQIIRQEPAEFFSFGTNDLTQMGFGFSRDDIGGFLPDYLNGKILPADPFQTIDQEGIGELIKIGIERGRATRPELKVGICGEHGGDPDSVKFCHRVGMSYVSCSPFRVPIARLAAAQAAIE